MSVVEDSYKTLTLYKSLIRLLQESYEVNFVFPVVCKPCVIYRLRFSFVFRLGPRILTSLVFKLFLKSRAILGTARHGIGDTAKMARLPRDSPGASMHYPSRV